MSEEERRNNFASTAVAPMTTGPIDPVTGSGQPQGLEVTTSEPVEVHEPTQPSLEADTIDNLPHPTTSSLILMVGGNYRMEVRKGVVYPQ
jgi:hypothetical protein